MNSPDLPPDELSSKPGPPPNLADFMPTQIGRYSVERELGRGGFGVVYLAYDKNLDDRVAIKVPHRHLLTTRDDVEFYLTEGRTVAKLHHAHIVPVLNADSTQDHPCFIVSRYIDGPTLAQRLKKPPKFSWREIAELVAIVADALSYAHCHEQHFVHRDVKPSNILLDQNDKPFLADFGLALPEKDVGKGPRCRVGTLGYMSPEQARGESHNVDGRSDIFSLGVVLYQMLTERRPFEAESDEETLKRILYRDPRPLREFNRLIPQELEQICLKALEKPLKVRYTTAQDMSTDLRKFLDPTPPIAITVSNPPPPNGVDFYLRRLTEENSHLTLLGMGRSLQVELPIAEAYVPLRTTLARSLELRSVGDRHLDGHAEAERNVELGEVFRETARLRERGIILLGEPGSGKTTGARQLAWQLASGNSRSEDLGLPPGMVPVLLRFRNLSRAALGEASGLKGLRKFLDEETHCDGAPDGEEAPGEALWNGKAGGLLWILDGLDEVVDAESRKKVASWLRDAVPKRPQDWFLVTCRFQGYYNLGVPLGPKFAEFHVRGLDDDQIQRFVCDWFGAAYGKLLGPGASAQKKAKADSDELLGILARPTYQLGHIRELCTNPLLLTILCIVFHEERKMPTGRAELYAHCVRVLLEYWRRDLYTSDLGTTLQPYDAEAAQAVLARVAWWLHQKEERTTAPLADLAAEATQALDQVSPSSGLGSSGADFLERMRAEAGILALGGEGAGTCGFLHLSFQEYLAAEHAAREGLAKELASRATESWWREVALLSLRRSRPFCEAFFREMLAVGIAENNAELADRCLQESMFFTSGPFVEELQRSKSPARVAAILRLLRERAKQVPELDELCAELVQSDDANIRGIAREILVHRGHVPVELAGPSAPQVAVDDRIKVTFVMIAPGEFRMGSEQGADREKPIHKVRLTRAFLLGKYPVTNAQYAKFLESVGDKTRKPENWADRKFNQPEQPVVGVSWDEAQAYCQWANCRLPTEAEWEYACRAGATTEYCFGDDQKQLAEYGWYDGNSGNKLQPVGAKQPNAWGLHDMHGNVWEWCQDWYDEKYYASSPVSDPPGPDRGVGRVFRGGSWAYSAVGCRSSFRSRLGPSYRAGYFGFRVARSPSVQ